MGGNIHEHGNIEILSTPGYNQYAEWNIFCDPEAAAEVFDRQDIKITMVGLDATNHVPITIADTINIQKQSLTSLGQFVSHIFQHNMEFISSGTFFAWDPLVAVYLTHPGVLSFKQAYITVAVEEPEIGRTKVIHWEENNNHHTNIAVAISANSQLFHHTFFSAFYELPLHTHSHQIQHAHMTKMTISLFSGLFILLVSLFPVYFLLLRKKK
jgi:inosine-uridine nucleoside N-ribohydrolase